MPYLAPTASVNNLLVNEVSNDATFTAPETGIYLVSSLKIESGSTDGSGNLTMEATAGGTSVPTMDGVAPTTTGDVLLSKYHFTKDTEYTIMGSGSRLTCMIAHSAYFTDRTDKGSELTFDEMDENFTLGAIALDKIEKEMGTALLKQAKPDVVIDLFNGISEEQLTVSTGHDLMLGVDDNGAIGWGRIVSSEGDYNFSVTREISIDLEEDLDAMHGPITLHHDGETGYFLKCNKKYNDGYGNIAWSGSATISNGDLIARLMEELTLAEVNKLNYSRPYSVCVARVNDHTKSGLGLCVVNNLDTGVPTPVVFEARETSAYFNRVLTTLAYEVNSYNYPIKRWCALGLDEYENITFDPTSPAA